MNNQIYLAVGEESARGTAESTTTGFIPLESAGLPKMGFDDKKRTEFRGEETVKGDTLVQRMSSKWETSLAIPFFTEAGSTKGMIGTLLKHFFGTTTSAQNGVTGQYYHMLYPVPDPFATANLGAKALTLNFNVNEGATVKNHAFKGGRVKGISFEQDTGQHLKFSVDMFGQSKTASGTAIASPVYPAENLRCDYNALSLYTGTITRTGTAPNYTQFAFGSATQLKPDKISIKVENAMSDSMRLSGLTYADKTRMGKYKVTLDLTIDLEAPGSGFDSWSELNQWLASASSTNFFAYWNTGTQAGTGDNHGLYIDLPIMQRMEGAPSLSLDKDPMITLKYEGLYDATTAKYIVGVMLKNTATAV